MSIAPIIIFWWISWRGRVARWAGLNATFVLSDVFRSPNLISFSNMVAMTIGLSPSAVDHRYEFWINCLPQMPTGIRLPHASMKIASFYLPYLPKRLRSQQWTMLWTTMPTMSTKVLFGRLATSENGIRCFGSIGNSINREGSTIVIRLTWHSNGVQSL